MGICEVHEYNNIRVIAEVRKYYVIGNGGSTIRSKPRIIKIACLLVITVAILIIVLQINQNSYPTHLTVDQKIKVDQILSTEMSRLVYLNHGEWAQVKFENLELNQEQVGEILEWVNETPEWAMTVMEQIPSDIAAGIVFKLESRKEIRIQYNLEKIFITRTDMNESAISYSIEQERLKDFFEEELKEYRAEENLIKNS